MKDIIQIANSNSNTTLVKVKCIDISSLVTVIFNSNTTLVKVKLENKDGLLDIVKT